MKALKKMMVPRFYGKNPTPQGEEPMLNDEGLLVSTKSRSKNPNDVLLGAINALRQEDMVFECVGTGLKIGRKHDGRKDSVCVIHNVNESSFGMYVLKAPVEKLPELGDMKAEGEPIKGANSHSSRITIPYEGNESAPIAAFIQSLPHVFESGRKTTFNDGRERKAKKSKKEKNNETTEEKVDTSTTEIKPKNKKKGNKKKDKAKNSNVVEFAPSDESKSALNEALDAVETSSRRKKNKKNAASA